MTFNDSIPLSARVDEPKRPYYDCTAEGDAVTNGQEPELPVNGADTLSYHHQIDRTIKAPEIKQPNNMEEEDGEQSLSSNPIMQCYYYAKLCALAEGLASSSVVSVSVALFLARVPGLAEVATGLSVAVGFIGLLQCVLKPWPRKKHSYKPNLLYLLTAALPVVVWIAAIIVTFYVAAQGEEKLQPERSPVLHSWSPDQLPHFYWTCLILLGALGSLALLFELGQMFLLSQILTKTFSDLEVRKGYEGIDKAVQEKKPMLMNGLL